MATTDTSRFLGQYSKISKSTIEELLAYIKEVRTNRGWENTSKTLNLDDYSIMDKRYLILQVPLNLLLQNGLLVL